MFLEIKNRVELELKHYASGIDRLYSLNKISPLLSNSINNFISRKGKRLRPTLFVIGYLGFARKPAAGLYRSAVALELLHDFLLIHDDIIDRSPTRRGLATMHVMLGNHLKGYKGIKFTGEDLAIVAGDAVYALALDAFLSIKESYPRKEAALKRFIQAGLYTECGEFIELLYGAKDIDRISRKDIYKIYDLKTADYTFATPLCTGALLGGAKKGQLDLLFSLGIYLGRAFQIQDDIIGLFGKENETGKSSLTDLKEAKKTILIWHAYQKSDRKNKSLIKNTLSKGKVGKKDLSTIRRIVTDSGTLSYSKKEISGLIKKAESIAGYLEMKPSYKDMLIAFSKKTLGL